MLRQSKDLVDIARAQGATNVLLDMLDLPKIMVEEILETNRKKEEDKPDAIARRVEG